MCTTLSPYTFHIIAIHYISELIDRYSIFFFFSIPLKLRSIHCFFVFPLVLLSLDDFGIVRAIFDNVDLFAVQMTTKLFAIDDAINIHIIIFILIS